MTSADNREKTLSLGHFLRVIWRKRIAFVIITFTITLGAVLYSFTLPNIYKSTAAIMPIASSGGGSGGISSVLGNIPRFMGGGGRGGNNFLLFLNSKSLKIKVVESLNLIQQSSPNAKLSNAVDKQQAMEQALASLSGMVTIKADQVFNEQIEVSVENTNPELATKIARQYLTELQNFISNNALTQAKRYRLFLEEQLAENKEESLEMEKIIAGFNRENHVEEKEGQLNIPVGMENREGKMRGFESYKEFKQHFDVSQNKEQKKIEGDNVRLVRDVPYQFYLKYLMLQKRILEENYSGLMQSLQMARIEEAKQEPSFQVLEEPVVPLYRVKPDRRLIAKGAFALSLIVALLYCVSTELRQHARSVIGAVRGRSQPQEMKIKEDYNMGVV
ncbi:MAG: hypothetical protein A3H42_06350 [Deltaproteobacteria bacterium RIFCSPLOWO2_02_FULL_46_8]|nr:MAG: hypothetical protein A3H42_06350 [Deltaproteobacteria bacterium RIFCSPLOWO2_02_FULL_46_8]